MCSIGEEAVPKLFREKIGGAFGEPGVFLFCRIPFDPFGAAGVELAAHVEVALVDDVFAAQVVDHDGAVLGH